MVTDITNKKNKEGINTEQYRTAWLDDAYTMQEKLIRGYLQKHLLGKSYDKLFEFKSLNDAIKSLNNTTQTSKKIIRKKYTNLKDITYAIINLLLIKKIKPVHRNHNFVAIFAALLNGKISNDNDQYFEESREGITYGDSGDPGRATKTLLDMLFAENLSELYIPNSNKINKYLEKKENELEETLKTLNDAFMVDIHKNIITEHQPKILYIDNCRNILTAPISLNIEGVIYILKAGILSFPSHAIAGLKCGSKYYVYDSNNYIAYCDWPNLNINKYIEKNQKYKDTKVYLGCLIYTRAPIN